MYPEITRGTHPAEPQRALRGARDKRNGRDPRVELGPVLENVLILLDLFMSSLRRGHANLLCIVQILTDDPRRESKFISQPFLRLVIDKC